MGTKKLKIAVLGAGAIGGVTGARMTQAGWDVQVVCNRILQLNTDCCKISVSNVGLIFTSERY